MRATSVSSRTASAPRTRLAPAPLRWLGLVTALVAIVVFTAAMATWIDGGIFSYVGLAMPLAWAVAAVIVMVKRPWHPVGWALLWVAATLPLTEDWILIPGVSETWEPWLAFVFETCGGYLAFAGVVALLILFPDGTHDRSDGERRFGRTLMLTMGVMLGLAIVSDPVGGSERLGYPNPLGVALVPRDVVEAGYLLVFAVIGVAVVWMWRRQRREVGEQRRRYTLVLYSFALLVLSLVVGITLGAVTELAWVPAATLWLWVPVAFAIAVVRHGLYGVNRLVSRTVTYGIVGVAVSTVFALPAIALPPALGISSDLAVASATLASAALFNPLRKRVRRVADRRFHRTRFDAEREVSDFSVHLRTIHGFDDVSVELQRVVARTIQPVSVSVWLSDSGTAGRVKAATRVSGE